MPNANGYWTWAEIRAKIKRDTDTEDEVFVRTEELLEYANDAIREAEAEIKSLYDDYFLTKTDMDLTQGVSEYSLPTDIYAHKIRRVIYNNGSSVYTIERIQDWKKFESKAIADNFSTSDLYQFFVFNPTVGDPKMILVPKARETATGVMTVWYQRDANRLAVDTDICDIPEFISFVFKHIKHAIYEKEGHPNMDRAYRDLNVERKRMEGVLATMVPDAKNEIEMDYSFYEEMN